MTNLSQITVKDLLQSLCEHMTSTKLQNAPTAPNVDEVKTSTLDTPANGNSGEDEGNAIHDIIANISNPTLK